MIVPDVRVGERLRSDRSNITAAFDWMASNQRWADAGELLLGGLGAYENYGHGAEALALFDRCVTPLDDLDVELADFLRAAITNTLILLAEFTTLDRLHDCFGTRRSPPAASSARAVWRSCLRSDRPGR